MKSDVSKVIEALSNIRSSVIYEEFALQNTIAKHLENAGILFRREYKLGPRNRIDFMLESGIGVEAKKGKQNKQMVLKQVERYASCDEINGIILVSEYNLQLPKLVNGKPCETLFLNRLWGIAL